MKTSERIVDSGGVRIAVTTAGTGPPVLLLHGFPDSWQLWRQQMEALVGAGYRVIAPDLRGHGGSDRPEAVGAYGMPLLIGDVLAVLRSEEVERAAVVGHDWGAAVAWNLAFHRPEVVERLAVLSVGHPGASIAAGIAQRQLSWYMLWFLHEGVAESVLPRDGWAAFRQWAWGGTAAGADAYLDRQLADLSRPGALRAALNLYRANIRPETFFLTEPPSALPRVACPVLGVWSEGDLFLSEDQMTGSADYVDGPWHYAQVPGSHWIPVQAASALSPLLLEFLG